MPETKYSPEVHKRIVGVLHAGNFREVAAAAAGIGSNTLRRWMRLGAAGQEPYAQLLADMDEAEAVAEARDIAVIAKAATADWKAAAWRLERKSPSRWATRVRVEVDHQLNLFLDQLSAALPPELFAQVAAVAAGVAAAEPDAAGELVAPGSAADEPVD